MRAPRPTKRATALHEAAHAVVAHHLGYEVTAIYLRGPRSASTVRLSLPVRGKRPTPVRRPCPVEDGIIGLAGMVAEQRARLLSRRLMTGSDARDLWRAGLSRYAVLGVLRPAANQLLRQLWPDVRRVARALEARRWPARLRHAQVRALLGAA